MPDAQAFSAAVRKQENTRRARGAATDARWPNALGGSGKNITPCRDTRRSGAASPGPGRQTDASASSNVTFGGPDRDRAVSIKSREISMPVTSASGRAWPMASESSPAPQPTSTTRWPGSRDMAASNWGVSSLKLVSVLCHSCAQFLPTVPCQSAALVTLQPLTARSTRRPSLARAATLAAPEWQRQRPPTSAVATLHPA
ncbi:hypothetical protein SAMN06272759_105201 [Novosphingobium sp. B1]|nr:hypothetical protein SAMN06272759_105201 [Novosphingobium sp. B1]